jgi:hypothetical protein
MIHQLMQAMLTLQIHVDVEFPVPYLYTWEDESRPYIIKMTRTLKIIDKTLLHDTWHISTYIYNFKFE